MEGSLTNEVAAAVRIIVRWIDVPHRPQVNEKCWHSSLDFDAQIDQT